MPIDTHLQPLHDLFASLKERCVVFVEPGGNWGDHLIYLGANHLAQTVEAFNVRSVTCDRFLDGGARPGEVIYVHGGGGFVGTSSGRAARALQKAIETPGATVIQGPCTLADERALDALDFGAMRAARLVFFAREPRSAGIAARALPANVEQHLNEDTAFYLGRDVLLARIGAVRRCLHLHAIREDPERNGGPRVPAGWQTVLDPARFAQSLDHWIRIHASSKTIVTDRTHSAICGAILGIPTTIFVGAYHKNRSMWEYSLESRGVTWRDHAGPVPQRSTVDPLLAYVPIPAVQQSWKLDRLAKRLRGVPLA